MAIYASLEDI